MRHQPNIIEKLQPARSRHFKGWHDNFARLNPDLVPAFDAALDAYERVRQSGKLSDDDLETIVFAACSKRSLLWESFVGKLASLGEFFEEARNAVWIMANDRYANVRLNAMTCLTDNTPRDFAVKLLTYGLDDKSCRVRQKAADFALRIEIWQVLPAIKDALQRESHSKTRATMEYAVGLLGEGFYVMPNEGFKNVCVVYRCMNQAVRISTRDFSKQEVEEHGLDALTAKLNIRPLS